MMTNSGNVIKASRKANKRTMILLAVLILLAFTFARAFAQPQTQRENLKLLSHASESPSSVASAFDADLNSHTSSAALALFADGATVSDMSNIAWCSQSTNCGFVNPTIAYVGTTQIRGWLEQLVSINVQFNDTHSATHVSGNNVSWWVEVSVDEYRTLGIAPLEANVGATVENGKFTSLSIELTPESTRELSGALAANGEAATLASNREAAYSVMASGVAFGVIFLGLVFPAVGVYYISRVKRLFATVPHLDKPWVLLGGGVGSLFVSVLLLSLSDMLGISAGIVDALFSVTLTICAFLVMSSMILMKRVMLGGSDE